MPVIRALSDFKREKHSVGPQPLYLANYTHWLISADTTTSAEMEVANRLYALLGVPVLEGMLVKVPDDLGGGYWYARQHVDSTSAMKMDLTLVKYSSAHRALVASFILGDKTLFDGETETLQLANTTEGKLDMCKVAHEGVFQFNVLPDVVAFFGLDDDSEILREKLYPTWAAMIEAIMQLADGLDELIAGLEEILRIDSATINAMIDDSELSDARKQTCKIEIAERMTAFRSLLTKLTAIRDDIARQDTKDAAAAPTPVPSPQFVEPVAPQSTTVELLDRLTERADVLLAARVADSPQELPQGSPPEGEPTLEATVEPVAVTDTVEQQWYLSQMTALEQALADVNISYDAGIAELNAGLCVEQTAIIVELQQYVLDQTQQHFWHEHLLALEEGYEAIAQQWQQQCLESVAAIQAQYALLVAPEPEVAETANVSLNYCC